MYVSGVQQRLLYWLYEIAEYDKTIRLTIEQSTRH